MKGHCILSSIQVIMIHLPKCSCILFFMYTILHAWYSVFQRYSCIISTRSPTVICSSSLSSKYVKYVVNLRNAAVSCSGLPVFGFLCGACLYMCVSHLSSSPKTGTALLMVNCIYSRKAFTHASLPATIIPQIISGCTTGPNVS